MMLCCLGMGSGWSSNSPGGKNVPVANPGFPRRGHQPLCLGQKPIIGKDFCQKLHETERNQGKDQGEARP